MTTADGMRDDEQRHGSANERLLDLLADRAVFGLDGPEEEELAALLRDRPAPDAEPLERLAAAVAVATGPTAALPAELRSRLLGAARRFRHRDEPAPRRIAPRLAAAVAVATAASVLLLLGRRHEEPAAPAAAAAKVAPTPAAQREELLATVQDAVRLDCAAAADRAGEQRAFGDVVWSPSRQRGFLRIRGLPPNPQAESRYRVWIIDGDRGTPVSGGVFDVTAAVEDVVVPILPRGFVQGPTMFAVTLEQPGADDGFDGQRVVARAE